MSTIIFRKGRFFIHQKWCFGKAVSTVRPCDRTCHAVTKSVTGSFDFYLIRIEATANGIFHGDRQKTWNVLYGPPWYHWFPEREQACWVHRCHAGNHRAITGPNQAEHRFLCCSAQAIWNYLLSFAAVPVRSAWSPATLLQLKSIIGIRLSLWFFFSNFLDSMFEIASRNISRVFAIQTALPQDIETNCSPDDSVLQLRPAVQYWVVYSSKNCLHHHSERIPSCGCLITALLSAGWGHILSEISNLALHMKFYLTFIFAINITVQVAIQPILSVLDFSNFDGTCWQLIVTEWWIKASLQHMTNRFGHPLAFLSQI